MKRLITILLLLSALCCAQTTPLRENKSAATTVDIQFDNPRGDNIATFEYLITGSPDSSSIALKGCMIGGTCDTIETYTGNANSIHSYAGSKVYDYFLITPTFSGGTSPKLAVNRVTLRAGTFPRSDATQWDVEQTFAGGAAITGPYTITRGLMAEYHPDQTTGTTLTDYSGNGKHGTFAATAPVWAAGGVGLEFSMGTTNANSSVDLPDSLNAAKSFTACANSVSSNAANFGNPTNQLFVGNSNASGVAGVNLFTGLNHQGMGIIQNGASVASNTTWSPYGLHCWTVNLNTNPTRDVLYRDGAKPSSWTSQNSSSEGYQVAGHYVLGATGWGSNSSYLTGTLYYAAFHSVRLTDSEVATLHRGVMDWLASKGITQALAVQSMSMTNVSECMGDSIWRGAPDYSTTPCTGMTTDRTFTGLNDSISGSYSPNLIAMIPQLQNNCAPAAGANVALVARGSNDIAASVAAASVFNYMAATCRTLKQNGCWSHCILATMLSRTSYDTGKNTLNGLIRKYAYTVADGLLDVAALPHGGADGASASATYFQTDGIHTKEALRAEMRTVYGFLLDYLTGSTQGAPCAATGAYAITWKCPWVRANPAGGNVTLTLPAAVGMTGSIITIINIQGSGANTVTVAPAGSEVINGSATPVAIANGTKLALISVLDGDTTGGNHWEKIN